MPFKLSYFVVFSFHPCIQLLATGLALCALMLGIVRFRSVHLGHRVVFAWNRHVFCGTLALTMMLTGAIAASFLMHRTFEVYGMTGWHWYGAMFVIPLAAFGLVSGIIMHRIKKKRTRLNLVHGLVNIVLFCCVMLQVTTGVRLALVYLFGK